MHKKGKISLFSPNKSRKVNLYFGGIVINIIPTLDQVERELVLVVDHIPGKPPKERHSRELF